MKKLQDQYKNDRVKMNEEMQALFKEHKVNPLGGCLPTILPLPIFFIIFRMLRGMTSRHHHYIFNPQRALNGIPNPHYLPHASSLYSHLVAGGGKMVSFGMDLGKTARDAHGTAAIPFYGLIVIMTASQYVQQQQMNKRNPQAANANPQMKITMQLFPAFYAVISLTIPASVVLYLLVSGLFRMAQNTLSYRYDPKMAAAMTPLVAKDKVVVEASSRKGDGRGDGGRGPGGDGGRGPKGSGGNGGRGSGGRTGGGSARGAKTGSDAPDQVDAVDELPPKNGGPPKSAVNVKPGAGRPTSGRVTPRGGASRSRRGR
jgi:YidC/Oxa1 family membrane protein insertase